jgi:hypothetical protein
VALLLVIAACGPASTQKADPATKPPPTPKHTGPTGKIIFDCQPKEAVVVVDDHMTGTAAELEKRGGLVLPVGLHRIMVTADNHRPFRFELILEQKTEKIRVRLQPSPQAP